MIKRNISGAVLALLGAAAALVSPFLNWYGDTAGRDVRLRELFSGSGLTNATAELFTGLFLPMLVVAVLAVLGVLLRSRLLVLIAGLAALAFTVLWLVRQYQVNDSLVLGSGGFGPGLLLGLLGSLLLLASAAAMAGRRLLRGRHAGEEEHEGHRHHRHEHHRGRRHRSEGAEHEGHRAGPGHRRGTDRDVGSGTAAGDRNVVDGPWERGSGSWEDTPGKGGEQGRDAA